MASDLCQLIDELTTPRADRWRPTTRRRDLAERIPRAVSAALARRDPYLDEARRVLPDVVWRSLVDAQAEAVGEGWAEVVAAVAVAIELLAADAPEEVHAYVARSPQIEAEFRRRLLPFERYALLVDGAKGRVTRGHVDARSAADDAPVRPGRIEAQPDIAWSLDAPPFVGRSHTLLLALLALDARELILPGDVALAATGELAEDGRTVRPVAGFEEKLAAWWATRPRGLLITAPPPQDRTGPPTLRAAPQESAERGAWIVGATLDEIVEKVRRFTAARRDARRLTIWDGTLRAPAQLAPWRLGRRDADVTTPAAWERRLPWSDRAEDSLVEALSGEDAPQGVVIRGAPGTGKSLLLDVLQDAFVAGALGRLGYAVSVRAVDLAREVPRDVGPLFTARTGVSAETLHALAHVGRLVVLIDGLDEVDDASLARIEAWLRSSGVRYLATARPTRVLGAMPRSLECEIAPLGLDTARALLTAEGRADLSALVPERASHHRGALLPAGLATLLDTPLGVSLLAAAAPAATSLRDLYPAGVYERVFERLLAHGARSGRLGPGAARSMQRGGRAVGARLALRWLQDGREISREAVRVEVERAGYGGEGADRLAEALEFGHLLVPGAEGFSFAHRTLAEWLAARGLDELVERAVADTPRHQRGDAEERVLDAVLPRSSLAGSAWWQTALFYAPFARAPERLLRRVLDAPRPAREGSARWEGRERFDAGLELAALCCWHDTDTARAAWALFARALTVPFDDNVHASALLAERHAPDFARERFLSGVARHLPAELDALCDLAGHDERWRRWFRERPERLLRAVPRERLAAFDARLRASDLEARREILRRHVELSERVAWETDVQLRDESPAALPTPSSPQARWEEALFDYWVALGGQIPPTWRRARAGTWPDHLHGPLGRWLNATPAERKDGLGDRVDVLERFVGSVVAEREKLLAALRGICEREDQVNAFQAMHERLDASPPDSAQGTLRALVAEVGVELKNSRSFHADLSAEDRTLLEKVRRWDRRDRAVKHALQGLGPERREELLGALFAHLRPGSPEHRYVVLQSLAIDRVPPEATVDELLDATDRAGRSLGGSLLPGERRPPAAHVARWRELAAVGAGRRRLLALEWCARLDGRDLTDALLAATPRDDEFAALRRAHLLDRAAMLDAEQVARLEPELVEVLPLRTRARTKAAGWKEVVLAALDAESEGDRRDACDIAREERLADALPRLRARFDAAPEAGVCAALEALVEPGERALIRRLLAWEGGWWAPGERLLGLMEVEDLPIVLARKQTLWRSHEAFERRLQSLGPAAHRYIREALSGRSQRARDDARSDGHLRRLLLLTAPAGASVAEFANLAREFLSGDRHIVWSEPGSLGADFDDPADQDFHSALNDRPIIELLFQRIDARLARASEEVDDLRSLFEHPSETVQVRAYQRIAAWGGPVRAARLGRELLEAHTHHTRTTVGGDVIGLALASHGEGVGEHHVNTGEASDKLLAAVRDQLSPFAAAEVRAWLGSNVAAVRRLALGWLAEVGGPDDDVLFEHALTDPNGQVVQAALIALTRTGPGREWVALLRDVAAGWSATQLAAAVSWWFRRDGRYDPVAPFGVLARWRGAGEATDGHAAPQTAVGRLLVETGRRLEGKSRSDEEKRTLASAVEQLLRRIEELDGAALSAATWPGDLLPRWVLDASPWMRRVWARAMARRGMRDADDMLRAMFDSDAPADRRVGLVELSALNARDLLERLDERWRRVTTPQWSSPQKDVPDDERPSVSDMFEVLVRGPVEFAWLLSHIARIIDFDEDARMISSQGEETLRLLVPSIRRWGWRGFEVLVDVAKRPGRERECAAYLLVHLRDEIPRELRASIDAGGAHQGDGDGQSSLDEFAHLRWSLQQRTDAEADALTREALADRIGWE